MMAKRRQGKIGFINILDKFGSTQCYLSKEVMGEEIHVKDKEGNVHQYQLLKYVRSNQDTCINQKPIANEGDQGITPDLDMEINPVLNTDTSAVTESFTMMNEVVNPILTGLTMNMNQLGLTSQTNTAQLILNNQQITLSYQQLQLQVTNALNQIRSRNITAWNNIKSTTISNLNNILSSTKNVTQQMIQAWQTMKNSIIQAANDIKSQSEQRFNSLWI